MLENNIIASHWLVQMVPPEMLARKDGGAIVIVSSIAGLHGTTAIGAYEISKAADFQLARNLAVEIRPARHPRELHRTGTGEDRFRARAVGEGGRAARRVRQYPARRIGEPDDIAGAAVFLASRAGAFVTGQTIVVDGGLTVSAAGV